MSRLEVWLPVLMARTLAAPHKNGKQRRQEFLDRINRMDRIPEPPILQIL